MKTLSVNEIGGRLIFNDDFGQSYWPTDSDGNSIAVNPNNFSLVRYVTDGYRFYPITFHYGTGLGWIAQAIQAVASIGTSIIGSRATKKANESAEQQLLTQYQIETLRAQTAQRLSQQQIQSEMTVGTKFAIGVAGAAVVGGLIYLLTSTNPPKKPKQKSP